MPPSPQKTAHSKKKAASQRTPKPRHAVVRQAPEIAAIEFSPLESCGITEATVRDFLYENPKCLGLGDGVAGVEMERTQPNRGGNLDLLLEDLSDPNNPKRYAVEIQRGKLDAEHIVRAIGYWDWERARFPDYEHHAVLVVEDIGRFFNVVYHINRQPQTKLTLILMTAIQNPNKKEVGIHFRKILTSAMWGISDTPVPEASREALVQNNGKTFVVKAEEFLRIGFSESDAETEWDINYTRPYVGLKKNKRPIAVLTVWPRKDAISVEARHEENNEVKAEIEKIDPDVSYANSRGTFAFKIPFSQVNKQETKNLMQFLWRRLFPDTIPTP